MNFDLSRLFQYIVNGFNYIMQFIKDSVLYILDQAVIPLLHALADFVGTMDAPCCIDRIPDIVNGFVSLGSYFSGGFGWFLSMADVGFGVELIMCVLLARFLLRRIPFIGG